MKHFYLSIALFIPFLFSSINAQDFWEQTNGPNGVVIWSLAINSSGHIFAGTGSGTAEGGVFYSTDNGENWQQINNGLNNNSVASLIINTNNDVFAGTNGNGVFRSIDNGNSWEQVFDALHYVETMVINSNGDIFAGGSDNTMRGFLIRSTNNGNNWQEIDSGLNHSMEYFRFQALALNSDGNIFAGTKNGIYYSKDNGSSWAEINNGLSNLDVNALAINSTGDIFAGTIGGGVFLSTDEGNNWNPINNGLPFNRIFAFAINSNGDIFAAIGVGGGVYCSTNNGDSWQQVNAGLTNMLVESLIINTHGFIYAGTNGDGVFKSINSTVFTYPSSISFDMNWSFGDVTKTSSYQIIGIPGANNLQIADVMTGSPGRQGDWRAFWDPGSGDYVEYDGTSMFNFTSGNAFWVVSKNTININQTVNTVPLSEDNTYSIPLHSGWNLISNPFDKAVSWSSVQSTYGVTQPIHFYQSGSYTNSTDFETYKGYYFYSTGAANLKIPYISGTGSFLKQNSQINNEIELILALKGMKKSMIKVGFSDEADSGMDKLDIFSPPSQFCEINISLYNEEFQQIYKFLQEEYREDVGKGQEYKVFIKNTSNESLELINKGLENFSIYEVCLLDKTLMKFYDLKKQNSIEIKSSNDEREYSIFIGTKEFIQERQKALLPTEYVLYQNFPNPFNPTTTIMFAQPQQSKVSLKVYNILGEFIEEIINDDLYEPGYHQVEFGASKLVSGVYIYKLVARNYQSTKKMIIIK
jgi:photosystem II stability/assembly factor-like uncharacterized protein